MKALSVTLIITQQKVENFHHNYDIQLTQQGIETKVKTTDDWMIHRKRSYNID